MEKDIIDSITLHYTSRKTSYLSWPLTFFTFLVHGCVFSMGGHVCFGGGVRGWGGGGCQIGTIVSNIPHLDFLNLSKNPLRGVDLEPSLAEVFSRVRRLVLINTQVTWDTVHTLTSHTPE